MIDKKWLSGPRGPCCGVLNVTPDSFPDEVSIRVWMRDLATGEKS